MISQVKFQRRKISNSLYFTSDISLVNLPQHLMPALIEIKNCSLIREDQLALDNFSLRIDHGESLAILGPNGSGKSSLLKLIGRQLYPLDRPDSFVRILGNEHFDIRHYRSHIGILSQDLQDTYDSNVPGLEVVISGFFDSISLWQHFEITNTQISKARTIMAELGIGELEDRLYGQLSTGQKRRLLLARALVHKPETLILDEPTTGLDIQAGFQYLSILRSLLTSGKAIILVTHNIHEIPPEIDRIVLMQSGRILADGAKQKLLTEHYLSELFKTSVTLNQSNGYYQVNPK